MYYVQYIYNIYYILTLSYCRPHGSWERCLGQLCPQKNPSSKQGCPVLLPRPTPGTEASYRRCTEATKQSPDVSRCARALPWLPSISPSCSLSKLPTSRSTGAASSPGTWASSPASFPTKSRHSYAWQPHPLTESAPLELVARTQPLPQGGTAHGSITRRAHPSGKGCTCNFP